MGSGSASLDSEFAAPGGGMSRPEEGSLYGIEAPKQGLSPIFPLLLALLPAILSLVLGEGVVALLTDSLLLFADGWILWNISNGTWKFYAQAAVANRRYTTNGEHINGEHGEEESNEDPKSSQTLVVSTYVCALVLHLGAPFGGGIVLYYSRKFLSSGSKVITNFNIFLYVAMELARGVNRLSEANEWNSQPPVAALPEGTAQMLERTAARLDLVEEEQNLLSSQLSALASRVDGSEENLYTELYAAWKTMEKLDKSLRLHRLQTKRSGAQLASSTGAIEGSAKDGLEGGGAEQRYLESIRAPNPYQQHRTLFWPAAIVWNSTVFVLLVLPFRLGHTLVRRLVRSDQS